MTAWETLLDVLISLIPPAAVGVIFWIMMRSILRADKVSAMSTRRSKQKSGLNALTPWANSASFVSSTPVAF